MQGIAQYRRLTQVFNLTLLFKDLEQTCRHKPHWLTTLRKTGVHWKNEPEQLQSMTLSVNHLNTEHGFSEMFLHLMELSSPSSLKNPQKNQQTKKSTQNKKQTTNQKKKTPQTKKTQNNQRKTQKNPLKRQKTLTFSTVSMLRAYQSMHISFNGSDIPSTDPMIVIIFPAKCFILIIVFRSRNLGYTKETQIINNSCRLQS